MSVSAGLAWVLLLPLCKLQALGQNHKVYKLFVLVQNMHLRNEAVYATKNEKVSGNIQTQGQVNVAYSLNANVSDIL